MTIRVARFLIIADEAAQQCDYCAKIDELRPYGKNGAAICYACAWKPENRKEIERQMNHKLFGDPL